MEKDEFFRGKWFLAPMAGVGDYAFRAICKKYGADAVTSEMISAKAVCYGDRKTMVLARIRKEEIPMALQLFGAEPEFVAKAAYLLLENAEKEGVLPSAIDLNMGCPVPKIVGNGEGSALMKNPALAAEIVRRTARESSIPVTVKMRLGWDKNSINAVDFAKAVEEAGASAVCVHARTRSMMYTPGVMWEEIAKVKAAVRIPVIGNGDVFSAEDAFSLLRQTGCDSVAVARGALGNPFIFAELKARAAGLSYVPPTVSERMETAIRQLSLAVADKGETVAVAECRKHFAYYTKGIRGASSIRGKLNSAETEAEVVSLLRSLSEQEESL